VLVDCLLVQVVLARRVFLVLVEIIVVLKLVVV
jgi:hypothetical protein